MSDYIKQNSAPISFKKGESWAILSPIEQSIKAKIEAVGTPLKDWDIKINRGILTGCNEAFIIDREKRDELIKKDPRSVEIIRPILRGRDIKRFEVDFKDIYLIASHNGYNNTDGVVVPRIKIEDYPAIKKHLDVYWDRIEKRTDRGDTPYNLRSCAYMDDFDKQKILYREISEKMDAAIDDTGILINNKAYLISGECLEFLCFLFNSKLFSIFLKNANITGGKGPEFINSLKVKKPSLNDTFRCENDILNFFDFTEDEINFIENLQ